MTAKYLPRLLCGLVILLPLQRAWAFKLEVSTTTGQSAMVNDAAFTVSIDQYSITSAGGSLNGVSWLSLEERVETGSNGISPGWLETSSTSNLLSEVEMGSGWLFQTNTGYLLGSPFQIGFQQDLQFQVWMTGSSTPTAGSVIYISDTPDAPVAPTVPEPGCAALTLSALILCRRRRA